MDSSVCGTFNSDGKESPVTPSIVFSIDFELRWGVAPRLPDSADAYRRNLDGARDAILGMLELFRSLDIGATWAVVGALACSSWDEFHARCPKSPRYHDERQGFRDAWRRLDPTGK